MEQKVFQTNWGNICYWVSRTESEKPWLVFLPGLSADHTLFDKQMQYFTPEYNYFVWDAPAHGLSRPFELKFSMQDMADYLHSMREISYEENRCCQLQVKDYSRYNWTMFNPEHKRERHETVFPEDKKKAFAMGEQMANGSWEE